MRQVSFVALLLTFLVPAQVSMQTTTGAARPGLPPRDNAAAPTGKGKISGRVLSAETNAPLRRALVTVAAGQINVRRMATTDAEGRYEFVDLAAGRYTVSASKGGYVTLQYGQRRAFEPGRPVALADGQDLSQIDMSLPRGSVIAGRVTDEFGEPIAAALVQVQRYQYGPSGQRRLTFGAGITQTNDLGEFRAYGLMPGEYVVSASVRLPTFQQGANPNDASEGYPPTYYPGTTNPGDAEAVSVGLGQELSIQLTLQAARMARISGTIVDSEGKAASDVRVMIRSATGDGGFMSSGGVTAADGGFTLASVAPGDHVIEVAAQPRAPDRPAEVASVPVTVAGQDISNLRIITGPGGTVSGVVVFEGTAPRSGGPALRVATQSADLNGPPSMFMMEQRGLVAEDGTFQLRGLGNVFFRPINLGPWMLKAVFMGDEDITDTPYQLRNAEVIEGLRVVVTDRMTDVSGSVRNARGEALKEYVVLMQPAQDVAATTLLRFLRTARPDQDGRFNVRGLPPGEYVMTAVEALEQGREWDPEYRPRLREAGRRFTLAEGESVSLDLRLTDGL